MRVLHEEVVECVMRTSVTDKSVTILYRTVLEKASANVKLQT